MTLRFDIFHFNISPQTDAQDYRINEMRIKKVGIWMISFSEFFCRSPCLSTLPSWQYHVSASTVHNGQRRSMCEDCKPLHPADTQTE